MGAGSGRLLLPCRHHGRNDGHFSPLGSLDRAQLAQVFCSFYEAELDQVLKMTPDTPEQPSTPTQIPTQVLKAA